MLLTRPITGFNAGAVRTGTLPSGPILAALRRYPAVKGIVFGPYMDASSEVHEYAKHIAMVESYEVLKRGVFYLLPPKPVFGVLHVLDHTAR